MNEESPKKYEEVVACWACEGKTSVHVKVIVLPYNDPVELTAEQARDFAQQLLKLADEVDA